MCQRPQSSSESNASPSEYATVASIAWARGYRGVAAGRLRGLAHQGQSSLHAPRGWTSHGGTSSCWRDDWPWVVGQDSEGCRDGGRGVYEMFVRQLPNQPAAPNAGIASRLTIEHPWPGVGEPERSNTRRARATHNYENTIYPRSRPRNPPHSTGMCDAFHTREARTRTRRHHCLYGSG